MAKVKLTKLAAQFAQDFDSFFELAKSKLSADMLTGKGKNTWVDEEGQKILIDCMYVEEIVPKHYKGKVLADAPNPSYVFAYIDEIKMKVPVVIARKYKGKMKGKTITIEMIEDVRGRSYRYVA
tara:strand:- start:9912 stop:10283 length:372 start_codon:yes stop_codon:yes gene_type:complete